MYVKSLRLAGFKSFADPTILEFESGVNVIVGPNGSGKSNIADALSWVLGSQAPSSLRGASMEDVIFAGSGSRARAGVAEVTLTLDNSDGVLPLDMAEVTITRSTDRSGTSEYAINSAPCRLLDITELLSDTGIGRSIHTVVSQGQLDAVLQAKPEDRRSFIEEAAQIGKYRRRKDRSLRKIERVDENLLRLNDVLSELRRAIRPLKRQAGAASKYTELLAEQQDLRKRLTAHEVRVLRSGVGLETSAEDKERLALLEEELGSVRARLSNSERAREELGEAAEAAGKHAHRVGRATDRLVALGELARERAATLTARLAAETEEGYRERIKLLQDERDRWASESRSLTEQATAARAAADEAAAKSETAREAAASAEAALGAARSEETTAAQALVRAEGSEAAARATLGSVEARIESSIERREALERALEEDSTAVERAEREISTISDESDVVTERAAQAESDLEAARERTDALKEALADAHSGTAATEARSATLVEVSELLADLPAALERLQPMIHKARDARSAAELSEDEARSLLEAANSTVEELWQTVARFDEELRRLDALMSGGAERLAGARRRREAREVELAAVIDEIARTREALASAERAAAEDRAAIPQRKEQLAAASERRASAEDDLKDARSNVAALLEAKRESELAARTLEERALGAQLRLEESEAGIGDAEQALEGLASRRASLTEERDRAETIAAVIEECLPEAHDIAEAATAAAVAAQEEAHAGERALNGLRDRERDLSQRLQVLTREHNEAEVRRAEARARIEALAERAMDEWALTLEALDPLPGFADAAGSEEARERVESLERKIRHLGAINPRAAEEYAELSEREKFLEEQMEDLRSSKRDLLKVVREIDDTIVTVFREAFEAVAAQFEDVFTRLFPGGSGRLRLTDPDDLLASGIEVEARPPGKNVKKLSLLSGGERSLVALCFLFSIFRARPSPFYLMDEVEAALDDINLQRFISLVQELEERAQILIVTHQKRTMEAADILYGVSMSKDGVTQVVAKRMEEIAV